MGDEMVEVEGVAMERVEVDKVKFDRVGVDGVKVEGGCWVIFRIFIMGHIPHNSPVTSTHGQPLKSKVEFVTFVT